MKEIITEILHTYCKEKIIENEKLIKYLEEEIKKMIENYLQKY